MPDIDRTRAAFRQRIRELDRKHCQTAKELQATLNELVELNVQDLRASVIAAVLHCMTSYAVPLTPVDTGRARAGWHMAVEPSEWVPPPDLHPAEYTKMIRDNAKGLKLTDAEIIYVINNVEYILALNAGWSKQQAGNFIDIFMLELGNLLNKMAATA